MKHLHRYDTGAAEGDARHPDKVVHVRRRDPSHLGAVTVQVGGGDPADEARAQRKAADQIGLRGIDSRVENGDLRRAKDRNDPVGLVPRDLRQGPLLGVQRIVGGSRRGHTVGGLGGPDQGVSCIRGENRFLRGGGHLDHTQAELGVFPHRCAAGGLDRGIDLRPQDSRLESHEDRDRLFGRRAAGSRCGDRAIGRGNGALRGGEGHGRGRGYEVKEEQQEKTR